MSKEVFNQKKMQADGKFSTNLRHQKKTHTEQLTKQERTHQSNLKKRERLFMQNNKVVEKNLLTIKDFWKTLDVPMIGMPEDSMLTAEFFHDTYYHLNSKGVKIRTEKLIDNLKPKLIKDS